MQRLDVTDRVWRGIHAVKSGHATLQTGNWTLGEAQSMALYGPLCAPSDRPIVFAQIGQSLDGRIATEAGDAQDISGPDGLAHLHRLRAIADAVVIGVKTALHDDPQLTVRLADGDSPARVVIDPKSIIAALDERGFKRILIEGGGITIAQFLEADLLDRLHIAVAPLLIGSGPQSLTTSPIGTLAAARRPQMQAYNLGSDIVFDCVLKPVAQSHTLPNLKAVGA